MLLQVMPFCTNFPWMLFSNIHKFRLRRDPVDRCFHVLFTSLSNLESHLSATRIMNVFKDDGIIMIGKEKDHDLI
jgi:hypothetical protein